MIVGRCEADRVVDDECSVSVSLSVSVSVYVCVCLCLCLSMSLCLCLCLCLCLSLSLSLCFFCLCVGLGLCECVCVSVFGNLSLVLTYLLPQLRTSCTTMQVFTGNQASAGAASGCWPQLTIAALISMAALWRCFMAP